MVDDKWERLKKGLAKYDRVSECKVAYSPSAHNVERENQIYAE